MPYLKYYVFIPFRREQYILGQKQVDTAPQIKQINQEWKLNRHNVSVRHLGGRSHLGVVKQGDVIYVHAHGYTNNGLSIGGDCGAGSVDPAGLLDVMTNGAHLNPQTRNLTIKLWSCFSGFQFAQEFHRVATQNGQFPGLVVDGYLGATRTTQPKTVKVTYAVDDKDVPIPPWAAEIMEQDEPGSTDSADVGASTQRVRFGQRV
jgi:hypothetical protein